ncbi:DUF697 domain-containing protein [Phenylobacterium sp.]|uniref:DUF697 domain-containing protein n=1 Tax=Phenylobacterium sp. TaxID=1871053 RepID=UPI002726199C|nr:DUF697 domain-containing protein [Phenylobacterium sp.]MDO8381017.1 DUF697 domain-containing protein [Phenylobacterium sp.]
MSNGGNADGWRAPIPSEMHNTVILAALGLGFVGLFGAFQAHADVAVIVAAWATMFVTLARQAGNAMSRDAALKVAAGVIVGIGGMAMGIKVANNWLAYTGVGTIPAMICNAGTNGFVTYIIGRSAARVFLTSDASATVEQMIRGIIRLFLPSGHRPS